MRADMMPDELAEAHRDEIAPLPLVLPLFSADKPCRKCGGTDIHTLHMEGDGFRSVYSCRNRERREHLHRTCRRCHFDWDEAPLDQAPRSPGEGGERP
jgi:hypothetical protein